MSSPLWTLASALAVDPAVPPKVRCKALDVLYGLETAGSVPVDSTPALTPEQYVRSVTSIPSDDITLNAPPGMPPGLHDQFDAGLLGGPPGMIWTDMTSPPPPEGQ